MAARSGGSHKGSFSNGSIINTGKPYGLMLLLAFGAALLGIVAIQRLRERGILNLLVQEKNRELTSLQLLLQKERKYTKEMKRKTEEMKAMAYTLKTQKMELDRRLLEMQSTIDSLKEEQKTMESALEEKQNEVRMLRETNMDLDKETSRLIALTESSKQKEAETEGLKRQLESPVKVWSVSADDPPNPPVKLTSNGNTALEGEISEKREDGQLQETLNYRKGVYSTGGNDSSSTLGVADTVRVEREGEGRVSVSSGSDGLRKEQSQMLENSVIGLRIGDVAGNGFVHKSQDENPESGKAISDEAFIHTDEEWSKTRDESCGMKSVDDEVQQQEGEVSSFKNRRKSSNTENTNVEGDAEQLNVDSKKQRGERKQATRLEEGIDAATVDFYRYTVSDLEEDDKGIKEETDETEL